MLLYIIRHGDPDYTTDTLTLRGMFQAEAVGQRMAKVGLSRVFSSPYGRAKLTASPTCRLTGLPMEIEEWSHEIGPEIKALMPNGRRRSVSIVQNSDLRAGGAWDIPFDETMEAPHFRTTALRPTLDYIAAGGRDFLARLGYVEEGENYRIERPNEEKVALFCHAAFERGWMAHLLHIPPHMMWAGFAVTHTGVTVVEFRNYRNGITAPKVLCWSDVSHLHAAGLDTVYDNRFEI